jgi:hypothetical protein
MGATGGPTPPSKVTIALFATSLISAVWAAAMLTPAGRVAYVYLFAYSEFYMGVLTLVSLSMTVMLGLVATDRMVLSVRQRVLMQSAHRTTGVIAVSALAMHVLTKLSMGRIALIDIFVPFLARNQTLYIGLGTLAGFFMVSVLWTGIVRARFAGRGKPWMWRSLHSVAYLAWPIALTHGLSAGRAAAGWVIASYIVCVLFVLVALAVRLSVNLGRRKNFSSSSTGSIKPVGKLVATSSPGAKGRPKRRTERKVEVEVEPISTHVVADRSNAPAAVVESWAPALGAGPVAPVSARPVSARPVSGGPAAGPSAPVSARPVSARADADDDYRPARSARRDYDDEPRRRYAEPEERYADDEPVEPRRRYAEQDEPVAPRGRRYVEPEARYDEVPAQRSRRRYAEDDEPVTARSRRYADDPDGYDEIPRRRRPADREPRHDEVPRPRSRGHADEDERVTARSRSTELERYEDVPRSRSPRYAEQEEVVTPRGRRRADPEPRYDEAPAPRTQRYVDDADDVPRSWGTRSTRSQYTGYADRGDSGRHSRAGLTEPADPWGAETGMDSNYLPPDDTPTLVDMASRRARRAATETPRGASRAARRRGRGGADEVDDLYFRQLRGEAQ